jgi:hypothetical protein
MFTIEPFRTYTLLTYVLHPDFINKLVLSPLKFGGFGANYCVRPSSKVGRGLGSAQPHILEGSLNAGLCPRHSRHIPRAYKT